MSRQRLISEVYKAVINQWIFLTLYDDDNVKRVNLSQLSLKIFFFRNALEMTVE